MAGLVAQTIVLAFGAAALGAPDALRLLLGLAGRGPATDITVCVVLISAITAHALGTVLVARFVRKAPHAGGGARAVPAPARDLFAQVTQVVSVGAAFLVTACHLVASGGVQDLIVVIGAACSLPFAMALVRFVRRARNATGAGRGDAARAPWAGTRRIGKKTSLGVVLFSLACLILLLAIIILYYAPSWREGVQTCSAA
ncbi:hypothetical protein BS78_10G077200 [Paspalum vaginatum]|nr:hypothetical protein BS78_10G077200 [Paspalum vaginatum]